MSNSENHNDGASERAADSALLKRLSGLPRERHGSDDLWPQIQARLSPQATVQAAQWLPRAAAAIFVLAIVGSAIINLNGPGAQSGNSELLSHHSGNLPLLSASAELEYSGALQNLLPLTVSAAAAEPGTLLADYEQSLQVVRTATEAVRLALNSDPGSRYLNTMLADLHHRQLSVLKEMARHADQPTLGSENTQAGRKTSLPMSTDNIRSTS
ncbi:MAG: hypothetical protein AB8B96_17200 [Lysobacterales bacterium]